MFTVRHSPFVSPLHGGARTEDTEVTEVREKRKMAFASALRARTGCRSRSSRAKTLL
jgi:hypothetical protein